MRYYEEQGLLTPQTRSAGGFRLFGREQVDRLALIKQMKPLGFSLEEMRDLLDTLQALRAGRGGVAAAARLSHYADAAEGRLATRREQLRQAEGLAGQLRGEAGAA